MKRILLTILLVVGAGALVVLFMSLPHVPDELSAIPTPLVYKDLVTLDAPMPEQTVRSPLVVRGKARGPWYFEASFPVILTDWDGRIIAQVPARAQGDWMTNDWVPFEAVLTFDADTTVSSRGALILRKDNPSGLPEHDDALEITVFFVP